MTIPRTDAQITARRSAAGPVDWTAACRQVRVRLTFRRSRRQNCRANKGEDAMADVRVVATGLRFPEGPVAMADGSVILGEIAGGTVTRVASDGTKSTVT